MKIEAISLLEHDSILESNDVHAKSEAVQSNELELSGFYLWKLELRRFYL